MATLINESDLKDFIRDVPDFPKPGILFKDITTLLNNPPAFQKSIDLMAERFQNEKIDKIVGIESRGFLFGAVLAYKLGIGFVPVRKKGKLPAETKSMSYELEYGTDTLEIHKDAIAAKERVLIVDDLLATGGTVKAVADLVIDFDAEIAGIAFLIELTFLEGQKKIQDYPVYSLIKY